NQIVHRFADEKVSAILRAQRVAAINRRSAGRGEIVRRLGNQQRGRREIIDPPFVVRRGYGDDGLDAGEQRLALEITLLHDDVADRDVVEDRKAVAPVVVSRAELRMTGDGFELFCVWPEPEIAPPNRDDAL